MAGKGLVIFILLGLGAYAYFKEKPLAVAAPIPPPEVVPPPAPPVPLPPPAPEVTPPIIPVIPEGITQAAWESAQSGVPATVIGIVAREKIVEAVARAKTELSPYCPVRELPGAIWGKILGHVNPILQKYTEFWTSEQKRLMEDPKLKALQAEQEKLEGYSAQLAAWTQPVGTSMQYGTPCGGAPGGYQGYFYDWCFSPNLNSVIQSTSQGISRYLERMNDSLRYIISERDRIQAIAQICPMPV